MMRIIFISFMISLCFLQTAGQVNTKPAINPALCFNKFQSFSDENADSALFYIRQLASDSKFAGLLQDLLHNSFAQTFRKVAESDYRDEKEKSEQKKRVTIGYKILDGIMSDNNNNLVEAARPIYLWTRVMQMENKTAELEKIANEFIANELTKDIYNNKVGRYALLIYQVISKEKTLKNIADQLFNTVYNKLKIEQITVNSDSASRVILSKRAWYRYLYAYTNFMIANNALADNKSKAAREHYKLAADFSPDVTDNNNSSAYFYDMYFLLEKDKRSFQEDYLDYLTKYSSDKEQILEELLTMALSNPSYKEKLKTYYTAHFHNQLAFNTYWINNFNAIAKNAPAVSLKKTDGTLFSSAANKGKWILIDFWGTWCIPCRKEHPDLDTFFKRIKTLHTDKIILLTVACNDVEEKVGAYMNQFRYSFPVAMADMDIEKNFNIKGYPTKILISPEGKYVIVPFGVDWVNYVNLYVDLI